MHRKLTVIVAGLASVAALAVAPVVAQATERHWYKGSAELTKGAAHTVVKTKGPLAVRFLTGSQAGKEVKCKAKDAEEIWNPFPLGNGEDQLNSLVLSNCVAVPAICSTNKLLYVRALGLPWLSHLFYKLPAEGDEIEGVMLEVGCKGGAKVVLEGELAGPVNPGVVELEAVLENSANTVEAEVEFKDQMKASGPGKIKIGP
jgi:hypothetical protein